MHPSHFNGAYHLGSPETCPVCEHHARHRRGLLIALALGFLAGAVVAFVGR